jgi:hypothetical protein
VSGGEAGPVRAGGFGVWEGVSAYSSRIWWVRRGGGSEGWDRQDRAGQDRTGRAGTDPHESIVSMTGKVGVWVRVWVWL